MSKRRIEDLNVDEMLEGKFLDVITKDQHKRAKKVPAGARGMRLDLLRINVLVRYIQINLDRCDIFTMYTFLWVHNALMS